MSIFIDHPVWPLGLAAGDVLGFVHQDFPLRLLQQGEGVPLVSGAFSGETALRDKACRWPWMMWGC